jgi:hypothetical protein
MSPNSHQNKEEKVSWQKSLAIVAVMFSTVTLLFPMIFGARATLESERRAMFKAMREDHLRRVAADKERFFARHHAAEMQAEQERRYAPSNPLAPTYR